MIKYLTFLILLASVNAETLFREERDGRIICVTWDESVARPASDSEAFTLYKKIHAPLPYQEFTLPIVAPAFVSKEGDHGFEVARDPADNSAFWVERQSQWRSDADVAADKAAYIASNSNRRAAVTALKNSVEWQRIVTNIDQYVTHSEQLNNLIAKVGPATNDTVKALNKMRQCNDDLFTIVKQLKNLSRDNVVNMSLAPAKP